MSPVRQRKTGTRSAGHQESIPSRPVLRQVHQHRRVLRARSRPTQSSATCWRPHGLVAFVPCTQVSEDVPHLYCDPSQSQQVSKEECHIQGTRVEIFHRGAGSTAASSVPHFESRRSTRRFTNIYSQVGGAGQTSTRASRARLQDTGMVALVPIESSNTSNLLRSLSIQQYALDPVLKTVREVEWKPPVLPG